MLNIDKIEDNENFEHEGSVTISGDIGRGATVQIKDGSLQVTGNVGDNSTITVKATSDTSLNSGLTSAILAAFCLITPQIIVSNLKVTITGSVGSNSEINSAGNVLVTKNVGERTKIITHNGNIKCDGNVANNVVLSTHNGNIKCDGNVANNVVLSTHNGNIKCGNVANNAALSTHNGNVYVTSSSSLTALKSHNGKVSVGAQEIEATTNPPAVLSFSSNFDNSKSPWKKEWSTKQNVFLKEISQGQKLETTFGENGSKVTTLFCQR